MKRNLKKLIAAGMTALLVLSAAACGSKGSGGTAQTLPRQILKYLRVSVHCLLITAKNRW